MLGCLAGCLRHPPEVRESPLRGLRLDSTGKLLPPGARKRKRAGAQTLCTEPAGTHSVRGSLFLCLRAFVRIAVQVRPYISNWSPSVIWRSTAVSWTRPFGYRSAMRVSTGCATLGTFQYRFISAGFSPCKNVRRTSRLRRCSEGLEQTETDVSQTPARVNRTQKRLPPAVTWHLNISPGNSS